MSTKHIVMAGLIITALVTALVLVDILPVLVLAFIALLVGLGFTYYAGLSRNRIEYIREQRLLLEYNNKLIRSRELSEVERVMKKYAARIAACENVIVWRAEHASTADDGLDLDSIDVLVRWVEENQTVLVIDDHSSGPAGISFPAHIQSLLAIPITSGPDSYGVLLLINKKEMDAFTGRQREMLEHVALQASELISRLSDYEKQQVYQLNLLKALVRAIEGRETNFAGHSERVARISCLLGGKLGLNSDDMRDLFYSALLHDIGKLRSEGTDSSEPDGFNAEDHPGRGALMLQDVPGLQIVREGILHHHERYDGSGEPQGLSATDIPFNARIIAVADIYDALTRLCDEEQRLPHKEAVQVIKKASGSILDPLVVVALEEVEGGIAGWEQDQEKQ